jgi:predicted transcriptional regulator
MAQQKQLLSKMSIYIPQTKRDREPMERLIKLGKKRDRSVNYLVIEAILEYQEREENAR